MMDNDNQKDSFLYMIIGLHLSIIMYVVHPNISNVLQLLFFFLFSHVITGNVKDSITLFLFYGLFHYIGLCI